MADIRIKDLPTTASQTASDDFIALDGTVNGTRKIDASAPSFKTSVTSPSVAAPAATNLTLAGGSTGASLVLGQGTNGEPSATALGNGRFIITGDAGSTSDPAVLPVLLLRSTKAYNASVSGASLLFQAKYTSGGAYAGMSSITGGKENAIDGNFASFLSFLTRAHNGAIGEVGRFTGLGNLLIGTTTDISGTGGLKVAGTSTASSTTSGALQVGSNVGLSGNAGGASYFGGGITVAGVAGVTLSSANPNLIFDNTSYGGTDYSIYENASGTLAFYNGTDKFSITAAGAATFAGAVTVSGGSNTTSAGAVNLTSSSYGGGYTLKDGTKYLGIFSKNSGDRLCFYTNQAAGTDLGSVAPDLIINTATSTFASAVAVSSSTASTNTTSGALVVTGGVGVGGALNVGGAVTSAGNVTIGTSGSHSLSFTASNNSGTDETQSIVVNDPTYSVQSARIDLNKESFQRGSIKFYTQNGTGTNALALTLSTTQAATFAGAVAIGNTTSAAVAAPSTHKVSILIGGVQYYLLASNV